MALPGGGVTRLPFPGNSDTADRWDPVTAKLMNAYPMPTTPALSNNLVTAPSRTQNWNQFDVRVDHTQSDQNNYGVGPDLGRVTCPLPFAGDSRAFASRTASSDAASAEPRRTYGLADQPTVCRCGSA